MAYRVPACVLMEASNTPNGATAFNLPASGETGFRSFATAVTDGDATSGDTVPYRAYAVDADGVPTGLWEIGEGVATTGSPGTLTRTTVLNNSSGGTSGIDFSAATAVRIEVIEMPHRIRIAFDDDITGDSLISLADLFAAGFDYEFEAEYELGTQGYTQHQIYVGGAYITTSTYGHSGSVQHNGTNASIAGTGQTSNFVASAQPIRINRGVRLFARYPSPREALGCFAADVSQLWNSTSDTDGVYRTSARVWFYNDGEDRVVTGAKWYPSAGTFASGKWSLYRVRRTLENAS